MPVSVRTFFGNKKGAMQEFVENHAGGPRHGGLSVGGFHLPENLGLAHHHGIQAGRHLEGVPDGIVASVDIKGIVEAVQRHLFKFGQKMFGRGDPLFLVVDRHQQFDAVAGGEKNCFSDHSIVPQHGKRPFGFVLRKGDAFPHVDGCGFMVESQQYDIAHGCLSPSAGPATGR